MKQIIEQIILHFKSTFNTYLKKSTVQYVSTEAPKGEFGIAIHNTNFNNNFFYKIRAPGFSHMHRINLISKGHLLADAVTIIGTQDIVFGEVDK